MSKVQIMRRAAKLPEVPFIAALVCWAACALAFCVATGAYGLLCWVPMVTLALVWAMRWLALRVEWRLEQAQTKKLIEADLADEPIDLIPADVARARAAASADEERESLVRTGELDGLYKELDTISEQRVAVGSLTGVAPSEMWRFAVLAIDSDGLLALSTDGTRSEFSYLLEMAHREVHNHNRTEWNV